MMPSVERSIRQGHEGFSGTIYSRQRIDPADICALYFVWSASRFFVLAHDHNAVRWENDDKLVPLTWISTQCYLARSLQARSPRQQQYIVKIDTVWKHFTLDLRIRRN